jgi:antitoxin component YwqK of YwqJK toxin-antitoxin module
MICPYCNKKETVIKIRSFPFCSDCFQKWFGFEPKDYDPNQYPDTKLFNNYRLEKGFIWADGSKNWYKNGQPHSDNDKPAVVYADGSKYWYKNGELHRDNDKPAMVFTDGTKFWYKNGQQHRDNDKPAEIWADGSKFWYKNGEFIKEET